MRLYLRILHACSRGMNRGKSRKTSLFAHTGENSLVLVLPVSSVTTRTYTIGLGGLCRGQLELQLIDHVFQLDGGLAVVFGLPVSRKHVLVLLVRAL